MRYKIQEKLYRFSILLEILIAVAIIIAICVISVSLFFYMFSNFSIHYDTEMFMQYINISCDIIIGIEFVKMLCKHNLNSVIEVVLFAIAREMIVTHTSPLENFLTIVSIAILFIIKKYLYVTDFNEQKANNKTELISIENMLYDFIDKKKKKNTENSK